MQDSEKEFKASTWAIDNKTSIWVFTVILILVGISSYISLPKEKFPDIVIPTIYVSTVNFGTSPLDMENLVTKPIEKQVKAISGVKKLTSNSIQDFSNVIVEFDTDVDVSEAKQKVRDAVDKARSELPTDLTREPNVQEVDFSEIPILFVNISGDYELNKLKDYAELIKDKVETQKEITRVDIVGALDREIQINIDKYRMEAAGLTFGDIERAVAFENMTISGGSVKVDNMKRTLSVYGEFTSVNQLQEIIIRSQTGATVYLKDVAEVKDAYRERESFARLDKKNVITLNIIKRSGENLIEASDKVRDLVDELQRTELPGGLKVTLTGDQSTQTRVTLHDLINTIIIGFVLVTLILMFFMGVTNAFFVAMSVPLSCFLAFLIFPAIGFALNMIVLFAFLLALGIVVDDAIVVIENTHRIFNNGKVPIVKAAKIAAGEVFLPVLSGTLTTLAPFVPLAFWKGIIGKFMFYLPITLIVTLLASLVVAYLINPVFAVQFMKPHQEHETPESKMKKKKSMRKVLIVMAVLAMLGYISGSFGFGNFMVLATLLYLTHYFILEKAIRKFQEITWPGVQNWYESLMRKLLRKKGPIWLVLGTVVLFFLSIVLVAIRKPPIEFFPNGEPNFVYTYITLPVGTDVAYTDSITQIVENRIHKVVGKNNPLVESIISNVAVGAGDPNDPDRSTAPNKGKVSVSFVEFSERDGKSTAAYIPLIRDAVRGIPGAEITVDKEANGPPVSKPINIEVSGDNLDDLISTSIRLKYYLDSLQIPGVEELKSDIQNTKPDIVIEIDRERANREGIATATIGMEIRNAVFGKEVSKFKDGNDDHPIQLRLREDQRNNLSSLMNMEITYRDMNMGGLIRKVPLSSVAKVKYASTFGGVKRKNQKRVVTLSSNVLSDFNPNEVVSGVKTAALAFEKPDGIAIDLTGQQEEQAETGAFLGRALMISLFLIFFILVTQFNSVSKPFIILLEIFFSIIGVFLGIAIFGMTVSIVMTGIGIVALAGIVVRNGILLVEFTDLLRAQGYNTFDAVVEAGKTRMTPVILTASAAILGLIPLAVGLNIDFVTMFTELNPHVFFGGESVAFWGPLSWTMIYGLGFATILTLVIVPALYLIVEKIKEKTGYYRNKSNVQA